MTKMSKQDELATNRFMLVSPLLDRSLDCAKAVALRKEIARQANISERTLRRYLKRFEQQGFEGLKQKRNKQSGISNKKYKNDHSNSGSRGEN